MKLLETLSKKLGLLEDPKNLLGKRFNLEISGEILQGTIYTENEVDYEFLFNAKDRSVGSAYLQLVNPVYFKKGKSSFIFPKNVLAFFCNYTPLKKVFSFGYDSRKSALDKALANPLYLSNY